MSGFDGRGIGRDRHSLIGQKYWNLSRYHCAKQPEIFLTAEGFEPSTDRFFSFKSAQNKRPRGDAGASFREEQIKRNSASKHHCAIVTPSHNHISSQTPPPSSPPPTLIRVDSASNFHPNFLVIWRGPTRAGPSWAHEHLKGPKSGGPKSGFFI